MSVATTFSQITSAQKRTLIAAALGWMLDAFDAMLYALVLAYVMREFGMSKGMSGLLNTLTLLASGIGGVLFGFIADRIGRKRALMLSILTYSVCSFASGLSTSVFMLAVFRFVLGLGMGGEWNTGATLVAETWPTELRAKAISIVQSSWAIGYAMAALVAGIVLHYADWRMVFFVGILPALVTLWIQRGVPESEMWQEHHRLAHESARVAVAQQNYDRHSFARIFRRPYVKSTFALLLMNFFGMFAWWGLFTWLPPYLSLPVEQGGRGFGVIGTTTLLPIFESCGNVSGVCHVWLGCRPARTSPLFHSVYALGCAPGAHLRAGTLAGRHPGDGRSSCILRNGLLLRIGHHCQRNLSDDGARARTRFHLQRSTDVEFCRTLRDRTSRTSQRSELGFFAVRGFVFPLCDYGDATA
jgi:MFS family permease